MNYPNGFTAIAAGKKVKRSSTALSLAVALALALPGPAALAGDAIPGVDVKLNKNPGGSIMFTAPTKSDGTYEFTGLEPGQKYDLSVAGKRVQTINVGANQSISGSLMRNDDGTASISVSDINGDGVSEARTFTVTVNPVNDAPNRAASVNAEAGMTDRTTPVKGGKSPDEDLPSASINTSRSNIKRPGIAAGEPPPEDVLPSAPVNTTRSNKKAGIVAGEKLPPEDVLPSAPVSTTRSNKKAGIVASEEPPPEDVLPSAPVVTSRSNKKAGIAENESPRPSARAINVSPVNDAPSVWNNGDGSDIASARPDDGDTKLDISAQDGTRTVDRNAWDDTWRSRTASPPKGETLPSTVGTPIIGIPIGLEGDPGSISVSTRTDANGAFHFANLPTGKYKLTLPDQSTQSLTVETDGIAGGSLRRGDDGSMSIFDRWGNLVTAPKGGTLSNKAGAPSAQDGTRSVERNAWDNTWLSRTASTPKGGTLPSTVGTPIQGTDVGLEGDPGSIKLSANTDANGAYRFDKLPAGKYKLSIAGQPPKSVTIGPGGALNGKVVRDSKGNPALLVIAGNIGIGTKSRTPGGVDSTGFGSSNQARESDIPVGRNSSIPDMPAGPGADSPGGAMDGAGIQP